MLEGRCDTDTPLKHLAKTHIHAHTYFLTLFMWQAKAPAGETHSTLYSLRTCDYGGKKRGKEDGVKEREERERGTGGNTRLQGCSVKSRIQTKMKRSFHRKTDIVTLIISPYPFLLHLYICMEGFVFIEAVISEVMEGKCIIKLLNWQFALVLTFVGLKMETKLIRSVSKYDYPIPNLHEITL